ncbi:hypothetical protein JIN84_12450 [Luteolibacter yonseiensis]|uniref:Uncharacterized protein n=1 Tax=Luteolibacter yonseiensis TaxID=1144680 RepID=A0A934VCF5_9BACT|nr:hypothetical protein [Luteolibacter yonseiensis]MBK1816429.1 hypothetical protein [Luteolibacter yonseiensis]
MVTSLSHITRSLQILGLATTGAMTISCGLVNDALVENGMSAAANDQIMLVRKQPESFGYQRLDMQSRVFPDLGFFVTKKGLPDFMAETHNRERHYFILYYLADREAFACRSRVGQRGAMEFAGPYPITKGEYRLLSDFRKDPSRQLARL